MKFNFKTILNIVLFVLLALFIVRRFYMKPKFINGEQTPDFTAQLIDGKSFQLSELKGNMVLLDFWGSWCGPCRAQNPKLVKLYKEFHGASFQDIEDFEIVSVAIERQGDRARWLHAIEADGMNWKYHILDESTSMRFFDSEIATEFGVKQIPTTYLLNEKGVIINVNPGEAALRKILASKLAE